MDPDYLSHSGQNAPEVAQRGVESEVGVMMPSPGTVRTLDCRLWLSPVAGDQRYWVAGKVVRYSSLYRPNFSIGIGLNPNL